MPLAEMTFAGRRRFRRDTIKQQAALDWDLISYVKELVSAATLYIYLCACISIQSDFYCEESIHVRIEQQMLTCEENRNRY